MNNHKLTIQMKPRPHQTDLRSLALRGRTLVISLISVCAGTADFLWAQSPGANQGDSWTRKADMPTPRAGLVTSTVNGMIYAIGGIHHAGVDTDASKKVEVYDPATDTWTPRTDMPTSRNLAAAGVVNGKIYVIGGDKVYLQTPRNTVDEYDPTTDAWTAIAEMPTARSQLAVAVVDGKIYAMGGMTVVGKGALATVEMYDPEFDSWERMADMRTPRASFTASVVDGKIYTIGSFIDPVGAPAGVKTGPSPEVEMYDPATDTWTKMASMPTSRGGTASSTVNRKIYVSGGSDGSDLLDTVEEYNPVTDSWATRAAMQTDDVALNTDIWSASSAVVNGRIYAIGGTNKFGSPFTTIAVTLEYTPPVSEPAKADSWNRKADMPSRRAGLVSGAVNGKIYAIGGIHHAGVDEDASKKVEEYDPVTDTWVTKANLPTSRNLAAAGVVAGKIYVIGGDQTYLANPRKAVEEYDPVTDSWTAKTRMPTARSQLAAAIVDGKIYAMGGMTVIGEEPLATVEAYDPATNTWERKADMPAPKASFTASVVDGKIYAIGSFIEPFGAPDGVETGPSPAVEVYDPATNTWVQKAEMPTSRGTTSSATLNGKIYVMGGTNGGEVFATVEEYDPVTDTWATRADLDLQDPDASTGITAGSAAVVNGRIYSIGGSNFIGAPFPTIGGVLEYSPPAPFEPISAPAIRVKVLNNADQSLLQLQWPSRSDAVDYLESQDGLLPDRWDEVGDFSGTGALLSYEAPISTPASYYRIRREPK